MGSRSGIKLIAFDMGGVIYHGIGYTEYLRRTGIINERQAALVRNMYRRTQVGRIDFQKMIGLLSKRLGISRKTLKEVRRKQLETLSYTDRRIEKLIMGLSKRYAVVLLTNISKERYESIIRRGMPSKPFFKRVFASYKIGLLKPDSRIYRHVLKEMGAKPEEMLFIDDKEENVEGARRLGIDTIRYVDYPTLRGELAKRGVL